MWDIYIDIYKYIYIQREREREHSWKCIETIYQMKFFYTIFQAQAHGQVD